MVNDLKPHDSSWPARSARIASS